MTNPLLFRTYREGDFEKISELLSGRANAEWDWEYQKNRLGNFIGIAEIDGRIVGHMALVPVQLKIADKTVIGCQAVDLVVHKDFRRQGIFLSLGEFLVQETTKRGFHFWYGFPNKLAHSGHLKYGWFNVCNVPHLVKPINSRKVARALLEAIIQNRKKAKFLINNRIARSAILALFRIGLRISAFLRTFTQTRRECQEQTVEISPLEFFESSFDDFWKTVSRNYPISIVRDSRYLNWRYFEKPSADYKVLAARRGNEIAGYIVLGSKEEGGLKTGYIVDILSSPNDVLAITDLISTAVEHFQREKYDLVNCWIMKESESSRLYYRILRDFGFFQFSSRSHPLIARVNSPQLVPDLVYDASNWFVTAGDSDNI